MACILKKYYPGGDLANALSITGYSSAFLMVHVLKQCGDNLTRDNVMRQAGCEPAELRDAVFTAWITLNKSPTDFAPIKSTQPVRFDGKTWVRFGEIIQADAQ